MSESSGEAVVSTVQDPLVISESEAFALLAHLVTSAELCMVEPYDYGVFRLVDAASRLAACMAPRASHESRVWLEGFRADVDEKKMWPTRDRDRYQGFLRETSRRTAEHLVARAGGVLSAPSSPCAGATTMSAERRPPTAEAVLETIRSRRVTRDFDERPVAVEAILDVLEAGRWATSGGNRRIHRFLVVRGRSTLARLRAIAPGMLGAPAVVIVICTDAARAAEELVQLEYDATTLIDVGTAAMNMMVAAHALGLGTCPVTSFSHVAARVVLDLPPTAEPELLLLLGHPECPPVATSPTVVRRQRPVTFPAGLISWERLGWEAPEPPTEPGTRGAVASDMAGRPTPVRDTISSSAGSPTDAPKEDHHT